MANELKPCPFCGGQANISWGNVYKVFYVFCTKCKARHPNRLTRELAIECWNRRATDGERNER